MAHDNDPSIQTPTTSTTPLNNNPTTTPTNFLTSTHYREWARSLKRSSKNSETWIKFLYHVAIYGGETLTLILTLLLGVVLPSSTGGSDGGGGGRVQGGVAILLHLVTCVISFLLFSGMLSKKGNRLKNFAINCTIILKPVRYWNLFMTKRKIRSIIARQESGRRRGDYDDDDDVGVPRISREGLEALVKVYEVELHDKMIMRNEAMFQSIPMALVQLHFLFVNHEAFVICNSEDVSRVMTIVLSVWHAAQAITNYDIASNEYQSALHFLSFFESGGAHPMRVYPGGLINISNIALLVYHFCSVFAVFYVTAFFLNASWTLCLTFLGTVWVSNHVLFMVFPELEEKFSNAPLGVHTLVSYNVQRVINIFTPTGTKLLKMTDKKYGVHKYKWNVPLVVIQVGILALSIGVTTYCASGDYSHVMLKSIRKSDHNNTTLHDSLKECSSSVSTNLTTLYGYSNWTMAVGDYLFPIYGRAQAQFQEVNDLFNLIHVNWLLIYLAVLSAWVYATSDLRRRMKDPRKLKPHEDTHFMEVYPIVVSTGFYKQMIQKVLHNNDVGLRRLRKLMVLTVLHDKQFMSTVRVLRIFPKFWIGDRKVRNLISKQHWSQSDMEVDNALRSFVCSEEATTYHPLNHEFRRMIEMISRDRVSDDKKLLLKFLADFDKNMYSTSSYRIATTVGLVLGWGVKDIEVGGREFTGVVRDFVL